MAKITRAPNDILDGYVFPYMRGKLARDEAVIRELLSGWVSEFEPSIVYDTDYNVIGICVRDTDLIVIWADGHG